MDSIKNPDGVSQLTSIIERIRSGKITSHELAYTKLVLTGADISAYNYNYPVESLDKEDLELLRQELFEQQLYKLYLRGLINDYYPPENYDNVAKHQQAISSIEKVRSILTNILTSKNQEEEINKVTQSNETELVKNLVLDLFPTYAGDLPQNYTAYSQESIDFISNELKRLSTKEFVSSLDQQEKNLKDLYIQFIIDYKQYFQYFLEEKNPEEVNLYESIEKTIFNITKLLKGLNEGETNQVCTKDIYLPTSLNWANIENGDKNEIAKQHYFYLLDFIRRVEKIKNKALGKEAVLEEFQSMQKRMTIVDVSTYLKIIKAEFPEYYVSIFLLLVKNEFLDKFNPRSIEQFLNIFKTIKTLDEDGKRVVTNELLDKILEYKDSLTEDIKFAAIVIMGSIKLSEEDDSEKILERCIKVFDNLNIINSKYLNHLFVGLFPIFGIDAWIKLESKLNDVEKYVKCLSVITSMACLSRKKLDSEKTQTIFQNYANVVQEIQDLEAFIDFKEVIFSTLSINEDELVERILELENIEDLDISAIKKIIELKELNVPKIIFNLANGFKADKDYRKYLPIIDSISKVSRAEANDKKMKLLEV